VDVVGGRGGKRKRCTVRVGAGERCADVLLPEFAEVAELCFPRGHTVRTDCSGSGGQLVRYIGLPDIHQNVLADDAFPVVVGEERSTVRSDTGNDIGIVETHETKGRGETFLIIRLAGVAMGRWIIGYALRDGRGVIEGGMIRRMTELGGRSRIAVVNGVVTIESEVTKVRGGGEVLRNRERIAMLRMGPVTVVVDVISKVVMIEAILPSGGGAPGGGREGEASMIMGGRLVGGLDGIGIRVVADGLRVSGRLLVWVINYAGTVEELGLGPITSGIVGIRGVGVGRRVEGVCGKGEIGLVRDSGGSRGGMVVDWSAAKTG